MGRELKRVAMDFNWPLKATWIGYLNPYRSISCPACDGSGLNPETKRLEDNWYTHSNHDGEEGWNSHLEQGEVDALIEAGRLMDFTHTPINGWQLWVVDQKLASGLNSWLPFPNGTNPTAEEVNKWSRNGIGHDAINRWICVKARAKRLGFYGKCELCKGDGYLFVSDDVKKLHNEWQGMEPPSGDGFQLWETTSEGSPISPVFASLEELCEWCAPNATTFGSHKATKEQWFQMLSDDFVCHQEGNNVFL